VPGSKPHYPPQFKSEVVRLYRSSETSIPKMTVELGVASESLRRWIRQHEIDAGEGKDSRPMSARSSRGSAGRTRPSQRVAMTLRRAV
jgi:transposase